VDIPDGVKDARMFGMSARSRRSLTPEQKSDAVRLVAKVGSVARVARDLDLHPNVLRKWVQQAKIDADQGPEGALTTEERAELTRLRRENRTLQMERDFLKKAAAFFAKEPERSSR
jgi:transposase